jgi:hypothetical protein
MPSKQWRTTPFSREIACERFLKSDLVYEQKTSKRPSSAKNGQNNCLLGAYGPPAAATTEPLPDQFLEVMQEMHSAGPLRSGEKVHTSNEQASPQQPSTSPERLNGLAEEAKREAHSQENHC